MLLILSVAKDLVRFSLIALPYRPSEADFPVVDAEIEPAIWVGADPRFVSDRSAFTPVIGKRNESSL